MASQRWGVWRKERASERTSERAIESEGGRENIEQERETER